MRALLAREGSRADHERVQRLCRDEGLRVRARKRKRSRVGASTIPGDRRRAGHPNHVWALGFADDQTADCRTLNYLNIIDKLARHALASLGGAVHDRERQARSRGRLSPCSTA